jgi:hypothetical protein
VTEGTITDAETNKPLLKVTQAADWMTTTSEAGGTLSIDARLSAVGFGDPQGLEENMDIAYFGKFEVTEENARMMMGAEKGKAPDFGDLYYYTQPKISSRSEKWAWVNKKVFLGMGKMSQDGGQVRVTYRIFLVG